VLFAQALSLERGEKAFHCSVVPAVAATAHAADDAVRFEQALEVFAGVLGASLGPNDAVLPEAVHDGK